MKPRTVFLRFSLYGFLSAHKKENEVFSLPRSHLVIL